MAMEEYGYVQCSIIAMKIRMYARITMIDKLWSSVGFSARPLGGIV